MIFWQVTGIFWKINSTRHVSLIAETQRLLKCFEAKSNYGQHQNNFPHF